MNDEPVFPVHLLSLFPSSDGMVGLVSPEALFSRLQTEGGKTEAESEVRHAAFVHCQSWKYQYLLHVGDILMDEKLAPLTHVLACSRLLVQ